VPIGIKVSNKMVEKVGSQVVPSTSDLIGIDREIASTGLIPPTTLAQTNSVDTLITSPDAPTSVSKEFHLTKVLAAQNMDNETTREVEEILTSPSESPGHNVQFDFDTASPNSKRMQFQSCLDESEASGDDASSLSSSESTLNLRKAHHHNDGCCGSTTDEATYENDKFEWTESSEIINKALPPSFSACYLYIRDKSKSDTLLAPGCCHRR
jgi:hypothetical protein